MAAGLADGEAGASYPWRVSDPVIEARRRRTFAIISHPDAGKTTLTEKLLLYGGALSSGAGAVRAKGDRKATASDWMELERRRGISISSAVLQFSYRDRVLNLLDTPGHRDFSEDTYRVLAASDAAVMVLDAAKGIENQTRKLFEVCRDRELPIVTFVNKWDRPARDPLELLDEIEEQLILEPVPICWPVGEGERFRGLIDRRSGEFVRYSRTAGGTVAAPEDTLSAERAAATESGSAWDDACEYTELLDAMERRFDAKRFESGDLSPVFFGSALTNFGVRMLLDAVADLAPSPEARLDADGRPRALEAPFSGIVFKVQANMDPAHRDRLAFVRVCSGRFERGMVITHEPTGKPFATKYAQSVSGRQRETVEEAFPGDVVGLVNANDFRVGDAVFAERAVRWPAMPAFAPAHFRVARTTDTAKAKQFRSGIDQLDEEGVVQVLREPDMGEVAPILAAVGPLQFEVAQHRLENEFKAPVELSPASWTTARITDEASADELRAMPGVVVAARRSGELLALFESPYWLARLEADQPELTLRRLIAEG